MEVMFTYQLSKSLENFSRIFSRNPIRGIPQIENLQGEEK